MGAENSRLRHSASNREKMAVPSIKLPPSHSFCEPSTRDKDSPTKDLARSRTGSTSSRSSKHPIPVKTRRLIQSCFSNPHESIGKRAVKRACETKPEFATFYLALDQITRDDFEDNVKVLLKKVVTNIDFVDEVERLAEDFGKWLVELRPKGFKNDLLATLADAVCRECMNLDSAVHRAHTTTSAFSQLGSMVFSSVREGFHKEMRHKRRVSNSFSSGSNGSRREKRHSAGDSASVRGGESSPRSSSPCDSHGSDDMGTPEGDDGFLKPPNAAVLLSSRSF